jgi:hypothetical protein
MSDGPSQVIARLDAHNRGGREYTREEMMRDLRSLQEQIKAQQRVIDEVRFYFDHLRAEGVALTIGMEQALDALDGGRE